MDHPESPVEIPAQALSDDALTGLVREFLITEAMGSEPSDDSLATAVQKVKAMLAKGRGKILFDPETSTTHLSLS